MKNLVALAAATATLSLAASALAGPPPMSERQLFEMADVVADVEVVETSCLQAVDKGDSITRQYGSVLRVKHALKGEPAEEISYFVQSFEWDDEFGEAGCSSPDYVLAQGWHGRVYLSDMGEDYMIFEWGGAVVDAEASVMHDLPACEPESTGLDSYGDFDDSDDSLFDDGMGSGSESSADASGCSAGGTGSADFGWLLAGLGLVAARRRRR